MLTNLKIELARFLSLQFKSLHPESCEGLEIDQIKKILEIPKESHMGDLAFPCFALSKKWREAPPKIAEVLAKKFEKNLPLGFRWAKAVGGYLNFFYEETQWAQALVNEMVVNQTEQTLGNQPHVGRGKTIVIDYSSPNVAKPMSIGHLRSTVIGHSLSCLYKAMGYQVIGINYLGDWGVQFGKLAWAHLNRDELLRHCQIHGGQIVAKGFNDELWQKLMTDVKTKPSDSFDYLYALYVVYHACAAEESELEAKGRQYFAKLESRSSEQGKKDPDLESIENAWRDFVLVSLKEYQRVYDLLGIQHEKVGGESHHEGELSGVVDLIKRKGLLKLSEGAQIVDLESFGMPPCLIQKSDGATLYATRDIAAALYRHDVLKADRLVYVVGSEQTLHFKQLFKVLELMGYEWAQACVHVPFGLYRFKEGKMSTRRGNVIFLEDVLDKAIELVRQIIKEKNPDLKNAEQVAIAVGTGSVVFHDLMNDRNKNIDFDWDRLLDFNGDTGPYVQYTHVRCCSVLAKWNRKMPEVSWASFLKEKLELEVLRQLDRFDEYVFLSFDQLKPNWVAQYLLELSKTFNAFYYEHRILEGDDSVQQARILLVESTRRALKRGLSLLGVRAPEAM